MNKFRLENIPTSWKEELNSPIYEKIITESGYSPWCEDIEFQKIYEIVKEYSLVNEYRMYELWDLVDQCNKLNGSIIEVGVFKGGTGCLMAKKSELLCGGKVFLADTFSGVVKASSKDMHYFGGEHTISTESVKSLIDNLNLKNTTLLVGVFPEDTGHIVKNEKFKLCHIDVDVYQSAKDIFEWIWDKMVPNGIIVFDDYGFESCPGITTYVNELKKQRDCIVLYNLNGHAIVIKM